MSRAPADAPAPSRLSRVVLTLVVLLSTLALDLWTKDWAWRTLRQKKPIMVLDPHLEFSFSFNLGAAFGFLNSASWSRIFFIIVTLAALAYMAWLARSMPTKRAYGFVAVGLIAAGAAGNLHDRLFRANDGGFYGVVDFIKFNYPWSNGSWPTFNIADVLLLFGVVTLLVYLHREGEEQEEAKAASDAVEATSDEVADAEDEPAAEATATGPDAEAEATAASD